MEILSQFLREIAVKNRLGLKFLSIGIVPMIVSFSAFATEAIDTGAAVKLAKSQSCLRCHGVTKKKEGPPYAVIAAFYKSNKDAEDVIFEHVTTGAKIKMSDGHKEYHKIIRDKSPDEIRNLVRWILAQ
jgi:cytochrome c551/c552